MNGYDESPALGHVYFMYYCAKHFFKELVRPKLTGIKVLVVSIAGVFALPHMTVWNATIAWNGFCDFGYYVCLYFAAAESFSLFTRLMTLHTIYFCCNRHWLVVIKAYANEWKFKKKSTYNYKGEIKMFVRRPMYVVKRRKRGGRRKTSFKRKSKSRHSKTKVYKRRRRR